MVKFVLNSIMIKVILADQQLKIRNKIKALLQSSTDIELIGEATNGAYALELIGSSQPDVLILDIHLKKLKGLEVVRRLTESSTKTKALILTEQYQDSMIIKAIECGAAGFLLKQTAKEELIIAVHALNEGKRYYSGSISGILVENYLDNVKKVLKLKKFNNLLLTKRERQILKLIVKDYLNNDIANFLQLSVRTIESHQFNIMKKLEVSSKKDLIRKAREEYFLDFLDR